MDPALLRQRQDFMKSAIKSMGVIPRNKASTSGDNGQPEDKKKKKSSTKTAEPAHKKVESQFQAANFSVLMKIVDYMRKRHLNQQQWPLSLREIMEELQLYDLTKRTESWLAETLPINPSLHMEEDGKFVYQPPYKIKGKTSIINLLKKNYTNMKGGLLLSEINKCIPNGEQQMKELGSQVIDLPTQINKRKDRVYFYNDPDFDYELDESFVKLWKATSVEHLDERKIEEYLQKHGITIVKETAQKRLNGPPKRKQNKRKFPQKVHNQHMGDVLEDYDT